MSRTCLAAFGGAPRAAALGRELRRAAAVLHARDHRRAGSSFVRCSFASKQSVYDISVSAPLSRLIACCQNVPNADKQGHAPGPPNDSSSNCEFCATQPKSRHERKSDACCSSAINT
ncbi:hypothetical protein PR003_g29915 [Phytophthora rubi]|uniref:Uncharacterized protein n=1 Tax=Phytophthora rubi TaxID=129364 RepID=A0A6A4BE04_9STRA|nr:hypothetical protein PR003_g29915 [Phytophthora rubi]